MSIVVLAALQVLQPVSCRRMIHAQRAAKFPMLASSGASAAERKLRVR